MSYEAAQLTYLEPKRGVWSSFRDTMFGANALRPNARREQNKAQLEFRQGAFFAYAREVLTGDQTLRFAMVPEQNDPADVILRTGSQPYSFEAVQLKELPPMEVDPVRPLTLEALLKSIAQKYGRGPSLTVAIHLNRDDVTRVGTVIVPDMPAVQLWFHGLCGQMKGFLVKDPFGHAEVLEFDIPHAPSSRTQW